MIDIEWIKAQPKPVAIHCPTEDDVREVLDSLLPYVEPMYRDTEVSYVEDGRKNLLDKLCIRAKFSCNHLNIGRNSVDFYETCDIYILVDINDVRIGHYNSPVDVFNESVVLSALFGDGVSE